jgi:hypothetical protein
MYGNSAKMVFNPLTATLRMIWVLEESAVEDLLCVTKMFVMDTKSATAPTLHQSRAWYK